MGAYEHYLSHHGVLGQRLGVRRYQNADGTLTAAGRAHYGSEGIAPDKNPPPKNAKVDGYDPKMSRPPKGAKTDGYDPKMHETAADRLDNAINNRLEKRRKERNQELARELNAKLSNAISKRNRNREEEEARIKEAAKNYSEAIEKFTELSKQSGELWAEAFKEYKKTGKNFLQRYKDLSAAEKGGGSDAAKEYLSKLDQVDKLGEAANSYYDMAQAFYAQLGDTKLERIRNTAKYT